MAPKSIAFNSPFWVKVGQAFREKIAKVAGYLNRAAIGTVKRIVTFATVLVVGWALTSTAAFADGGWVVDSNGAIETGSVWPRGGYEMAWQNCDWQHCQNTVKVGDSIYWLYIDAAGEFPSPFLCDVYITFDGWYSGGWDARNNMVNSLLNYHYENGGWNVAGNWQTKENTWLRDPNGGWVNIHYSVAQPDDCVAG